MGHRDVTDEKANEMLKTVDRNNDKVIQWEEFLEMFKNMKTKDSEEFKKVLVTKAG